MKSQSKCHDEQHSSKKINDFRKIIDNRFGLSFTLFHVFAALEASFLNLTLTTNSTSTIGQCYYVVVACALQKLYIEDNITSLARISASFIKSRSGVCV